MPRNKDLKQLVRARMNKTGEAYTAARAQILKRPKTKTRAQAAPAPLAPAIDYAALAGMSDEKIAEKTGRTWEQWARDLDRHNAARLSHTEIAQLVHGEFKVGDWWSQTVTVGYERIKGLRVRGQRRDGSYEASKSRTYNVPVETLFDAFADTKLRKRWLPNVKLRTATAHKSARLRFEDGTIVAVGFLPKGDAKSSVAVQHTKLPDRETAEQLKQYWTERLVALGKVLTSR
jgi:hypothetical protein